MEGRHELGNGLLHTYLPSKIAFFHTNMYSSSLLRSPCAMFLVFPEGGFSRDKGFCGLLTNFRPAFAEAEVGRFAEEVGREALDYERKTKRKNI